MREVFVVSNEQTLYKLKIYFSFITDIHHQILIHVLCEGIEYSS